MGMWRRTVGTLGLDLGDGGPTLLDLRFADDILICATRYIDAEPAFGRTRGVFIPGRAHIEHGQNQGDDYGGSTAIISVNPSWFTNRNS